MPTAVPTFRMAQALTRPAVPGTAQPAAALMLFGQFVGAWDLDVTYIAADGRTETLPGEWLFGWILEGCGVQDVWRVPPGQHGNGPDDPPSGFGTTVRFYDPALEAWRSTWHGVIKGEVIAFIGRPAGDEIHLVHEDAHRILRWAFFDIVGDSFAWRNENSTDAGRTWTCTQAMRARRRSY